MAQGQRNAPPARRRGAVAAGGDKKKRGGWLWLLLLLLLVAAIVALVLLLSGGGDDNKSDRNGQAQQARPSGGAKLTAGGQPMLPVPSGGKLDSFPGKDATGTEVTVQKVVENEGFWVGTSQQDRVYVEFGGGAGQDEGDEQPPPKVGNRVSLQGPVRPAPPDPGKTLKLDGEDAQQVSEQGAYINADRVTPAG